MTAGIFPALRAGGSERQEEARRRFSGGERTAAPGRVRRAKGDRAEGYNSLFSGAKLVSPYTVTLKATQASKGLANLRWAPSKSATLLKSFPEGSQVTVLAELKNWYQVSDPVSGVVGFINTAYVSK